jgi:hypothetical protein
MVILRINRSGRQRQAARPGGDHIFNYHSQLPNNKKRKTIHLHPAIGRSEAQADVTIKPQWQL